MELKERIQAGLDGKFEGLQNGFSRINDYIFGVQRGTYYLLGAQSGNFKTTLCDYMLINCIQDAKVKGIPLNVFYYSFEIDRLTKQCNWLSQIVYQKYNRVISPEKIKGLGKFRLNTEEQQIVQECIPEVLELFSYIKFEFSPINPTGVYNNIWKFCEQRGKFEHSEYINSEGQKKLKIEKFIPDNPQEITLVISDHLGLLKLERGYEKKQNIDKYSEYCIELKNMFGCSFINIQQFNRSLSSVERVKFQGVDLSPQESDFKDSGNCYQDADVAIGLMVPYKLDVESSLGYNINLLKEKFLMMKIIKNRLSQDNIAVGLYTNAQAGSFKELPSSDKINYNDYK